MNASAWKVFRSRFATSSALIVTSLLLIASGYGAWWAFSTPVNTSKDITLLSYQQTGKFDHQVYADPGTLDSTASAEKAKMVYFTKLIESVNVTFDYRFIFPELTGPTTSLARVSAVLENPGMWQYEVLLVPDTRMTGNFTMVFPLDTKQLEKLAKDIGAEIGISNASPSITLKASVQTEAPTKFGVLNRDFNQTTNVKFSTTTMEWDKKLSRSERGLYGGLRYEQQGIFDYAIKIGPSILYGESRTVTANTPPPEPPFAIPGSLTYNAAGIAGMDVMFSYQFGGAQPQDKATEEVEVKAFLKNPDHWTETITLVPKTKQAGDFTLTIPLDLPQFYKVIEAKQQELRTISPSHELLIQAEVRSTAPNNLGPIEEAFTHNLNLTLGSRYSIGLVKDSNKAKTQPGQIIKSVASARPEVELARKWSPVLLGTVLLGSLFVLWNYFLMRPRRPSLAEAEFLRARKKYKNVIVDSEEIPHAKNGEVLISMTSLEGLLKTADNLLKPVLHKSDKEKHTYGVIDGATRYQYVSQDGSLQKTRDESPKGSRDVPPFGKEAVYDSVHKT